MPFPSDEELERMRKILEKSEGSRVVGEEGTKIEKFKFEICQRLIGFYLDSKMSQKEFAIFLGIDEALISKLIRCKIEVFTIDRLLKYLEVIEPEYRIELSV